MFFGFCKTVLRNALSNFYRHESKRYKHEIPAQDELFLHHRHLSASDKYPSDYHILQVEGWIIHLQNDHLFHVLQQLPEKQLIVIILYFWYELTEDEIAKLLQTPRPTIHYRKSQAIKRLQTQLTQEALLNGTGF